MNNKKLCIGIGAGVASLVAGVIAIPKICTAIRNRRYEKEMENDYYEAVKEYDDLCQKLEQLEKVHAEALKQFKELDLSSEIPEDVVNREVLRNQINFAAKSHKDLRAELAEFSELWGFDEYEGPSLGFIVAVEVDDEEDDDSEDFE